MTVYLVFYDDIEASRYVWGVFDTDAKAEAAMQECLSIKGNAFAHVEAWDVE